MMNDQPASEDANVLRLQLELHLDREPISGEGAANPTGGPPDS